MPYSNVRYRSLFPFLILVIVQLNSAQIFNPDLSQANYIPQNYLTTVPQAGIPASSNDSPSSPINPETYLLGPGDIIGVDIFSKVYSKFSLKVNPQNGVVFPQIGFLSVHNHTILSFEKELSELLSKRLKCDSVKAYLEKGKMVRVSVYGAVINPGEINLEYFSRLSDALHKIPSLPWGKKDKIEIANENGSSKEYNLFKAMKMGELNDNPLLVSGMRIFVPSCLESGPSVFYSEGAFASKLCLPDGATVSDLPILSQKNLSQLDYQIKIEIKRDNHKIVLTNYSQEALLNGDTIIVKTSEGKIYVSGSVTRPGGFSYDPTITIQQYVSQAGGEEWRGTRTGWKVFRDRQELAVTDSLQLEPGDIVMVPGRSVLRFNEYLSALVAAASLIIAAKSIGIF